MLKKGFWMTSQRIAWMYSIGIVRYWNTFDKKIDILKMVLISHFLLLLLLFLSNVEWLTTRPDVIKLFCCIFYILSNGLVTLGLIKFYRNQWYNLWMIVTSWSVCPWQAFPAKSNVCKKGRCLPVWSIFQVLHSRVGSWPYPQTLHIAGKIC
jgi:hypothetical protein